MLDFSISGLLASLIFSVLGFWVFKEGKRRNNLHWLVIGIFLMVYTYFVNSIYLDWGVGVVLVYGAYHFRNE